MDIGGAALYSVALIAARGLLRVVSRASRILASGWQLAVEGTALHGESLRGMPPTQNNQSDGER
jgi:hypothetical protein